MPKMPQVHDAFERCLRSLAAEHGVWIVGGWVRDALLGLPPHDADFATRAPHGAILEAARISGLGIIHDQVARAHGIFRLNVPHTQEVLDLACLRTDTQRLGDRHAEVAFTDSITQDLSRRDLTINAMAVAYPWDGADPEVIDPHGGATHLTERLLKLVGPPADRLDEDPLRLLRVARFACLGDGWTLHDDTCAALEPAAPKLARISFERVRQELFRAMAMAAPARFWQVVARAKAQGFILPLHRAPTALSMPRAIVWLRQVAQRTSDANERLFAFFVGLLARGGSDHLGFNEAALGGQFVSESLNQLRCARAVCQGLAHAVAHFPWQPHGLRGEALARWLIALGAPGYRLMDATLAAAATLQEDGAEAYPALRARVHAMVGEGPWPHGTALGLTGQELMARTGLPPGPRVGHLLQELLVWATAHGCLTDSARLAVQADILAARRPPPP